MATSHEARIYELDRALAPGSETALLGDAMHSLRTSADPAAEMAWWVGAYRLYGWALANPERWARDVGREAWDSPSEQVLHAGDDWTGWTPPAPTPEDLRSWREREQLTQTRAATIAGVDLRAWQRWESGERAVPQWLADVLIRRWGTAP